MNLKRLFLTGLALFLATSGWPVATPAQAQSRQLKQIGNGVALVAAWSPDGNRLAIGGSLGIWLYTPDLKLIAHFDSNDMPITALAWNPNGRQIATNSRTSEVQLWDATTGGVQSIQKTAGDAQPAKSLSYSADGAQLASANGQNSVHLWDTTGGKLVQTFKITGSVDSVVWEPDSTRIAVGGALGTGDNLTGFIQLWEPTTSKIVRTFTTAEITQGGRQTCDPTTTPGSPVPPVSIIRWTVDHRLIALFDAVGSGVFAWDMNANRPAKPIQLEPGADSLACYKVPTDIAFSPDGSVYASLIIQTAFPSDGGPAATVSANVGNTFSGFLMDRAPRSLLAWRPDDHTLVVVDDSGVILVFDVQKDDNSPGDYPSLSPINTLTTFQDLGIRYDDAIWSQAGSQPLLTTYQTDPTNEGALSTIQMIDILTGAIIHTTQFTAGQPMEWILSPDGRWLAGGIDNMTPPLGCEAVTVYDALTGEPATDRYGIDPSSVSDKQVQNNLECLYHPAWSADSKRIAAMIPTDPQWSLIVWDTTSGNLQVSHAIPIGSSGALVWSPTGTDIAIYDSPWTVDNAFRVFDLKTAQVIITFDGDPRLATLGVLWNPTGQSVAMLSSDNTIRIWSIPTGKLLQTLPGHAVDWNADATRLAIAGEDHVVKLYDTQTAKVTATLKSDADSTISTAFSPDGKRIATADSDGAIRVWEVATGKLLVTLTGHKGAVEWIKWRPDGSQLLSKGDDGTLRLWDAHS